jgi:hypothetical protein
LRRNSGSKLPIASWLENDAVFAELAPRTTQNLGWGASLERFFICWNAPAGPGAAAYARSFALSPRGLLPD